MQNLVRLNARYKNVKRFEWFIDRDYTVNWILDNMPSAWRQTWFEQTTEMRFVHYESGFPIGWKDEK